MKKILFILMSLAILSACERKIDEFKASANGLDLSNFVSVGNSLTAGYADGALYLSGQQNSIPNIMATQFKTVGGGEFRQPLIGTEEGVGFQPVPGGLYCYTKRVLYFTDDLDCAGVPVVPETKSFKPGFVSNPEQSTLIQQLYAPPTVAGPYNNMGVPGATVQTLFYPGYGSSLGNPYFARFATSPLATIMHDAVVQQPSFFYLWIGNNDVLASALAGTDALLTSLPVFTQFYTMAVDSLLASGKNPKGIVANIPDVTSIPFFTTISQKLPWNGVLLDSAQAAGLNQLYSLYGHSDIKWKKGQNPFVYTKTDGTWAQMHAGDLFLLTMPTDSVKCKGMGIADQSIQPIPRPYPIPGKFVLDGAEQANIKARLDEFNTVIYNVAASRNLAFADMNTYLRKFASGMVFDGIKMNTSFISGGLFSTDGVHLNPRGNCVTANFFIQAINTKYGSSIPQASVTNYTGLVFP
ncbi:MAG: hypothetical protein NT040_08270 [Bacteroidetes bacterium]|nr:hypothetical protein [Bacteroidota bacterium]